MVLVFFLLLMAPWPGQLQASHCDKTQIYHDDFGYGYNINCQFLTNQNLDLLKDIKIVNEIALFIDRCTLQDLPPNIFSSLRNIRTISLSNSTFTIGNSENAIFRNLSRLERLEVLNTRFSLSKDTFKGLDNLKQLTLVNNGLNLSRDDAIELFSHLENLKILKVENNAIRDILSIPMCKLLHLKELDLQGNDIHSLKSATFICHHDSKPNTGVKLQIDNLHIPITSQHFFKVSDLTSNLLKLNLNHNRIYDLGYGLDGLVNLRQLYLQGNQLVELNGFVFHALYKIETIDLSYNLINSIKENVFSGKLNLRELDLSHNRIVKLGLDVAHLKVLNLEHNNCNDGCFLDSVPKLKMLENLNLSGNNITTITNLTSTSLKKLNLNNNRLKLFGQSFSNLPYLEELDLRNCHLQELPISLFHRLNNLKFLDLSHNILNDLNISLFNSLHRLKYLNLSYNQIENIQYEFFKSLDNLESLDLSDNQLQTVQYEQIFTLLPSLSKINIKNNLFSCDFLSKIIHFLNDKNINFTIHEPIYDHENIDGISCHENQNANVIIDKGNRRKNESESTSRLQVEDESAGGMSAFSVVFILGIVIISISLMLYKLLAVIRKRKRRLDEFELMG